MVRAYERDARQWRELGAAAPVDLDSAIQSSQPSKRLQAAATITPDRPQP